MRRWPIGVVLYVSTGAEAATVDALLDALLAAEATLDQPPEARVAAGAHLEAQLAAFEEPLAAVIVARVMRAIGACRTGAERDAWWSAARRLDGWLAYGVRAAPDLREAAATHQPGAFDALPLAVQWVERVEAARAVPREPSRRHHSYSWFPLPRVWGVLGVRADGGPAHALGGSLGAGSTAVVYIESHGGGDWGVGAGTHSFIGDSYNHHRGDGELMCRVLHRHYVRPGLTVGGLREDAAWGVQVRPEVHLGAVLNLLVRVPVIWRPEQGWTVGGQVGVALGLP